MSIVRVMFVGHGPSNLPADRIVNVFHFVGPNDYETDSNLARIQVEGFYLDPNTTRPIAQWLSPWVQRDAEFRLYDMEAPKPRVPTVVPFSLGAVPSTEGYVEEVALCITMHGIVPPALTARRRGRIYIGPLNNFGVVGGTSSTASHPQPTLIADLQSAAATLAQFNTGFPQWSIRSMVPAENYVSVFNGYVDNAFDTQRRRGPDPTQRNLWESIIP